MIALIDGDSIAYRCAAASENDEDWIAISRCNESIERILESTQATECQVWLSDSSENNFRYKLYPAYKANRPPERPRWLAMLKTFLSEEWGARVADGQEADDALGIAQTNSGGNSIICANDKDMLMIPGKHFNFVKLTYLEQDEISGMRHFYKQCMSGDRVDNIIKPAHLKGFGEKKIEAMLGYVDDPLEMFELVRDKYNDDAALLLNGRLLWVRRKEKEIWNFPNTLQETGTTFESFSLTPDKSDPASVAISTEVIGDPKVGDSMALGQTTKPD